MRVRDLFILQMRRELCFSPKRFPLTQLTRCLGSADFLPQNKTSTAGAPDHSLPGEKHGPGRRCWGNPHEVSEVTARAPQTGKTPVLCRDSDRGLTSLLNVYLDPPQDHLPKLGNEHLPRLPQEVQPAFPHQLTLLHRPPRTG